MNLEAIAAQIAQTIQKEANINAIFGEPKQLDQHTIIPVARIKVAFGGGAGSGSGLTPRKKDEAPESVSSASAIGGGGGLEIEVQPLGFIRDGADGPTFIAIEPTPEGLLGKVEHLIKGLRPGQKAGDAGH
jgi:uncharacterized spore protein YtfJ